MQNIRGEIYEVDENMLKVLDKLESKGVWYDSKEIEINMESDETSTLTCSCYVLNNFHEHIFNLEHLQEYGKNTDLVYVEHSARPSDKSWADIISETKRIAKD